MEANYFYLAILHFLNENGGSCSVDKLKENLPILRDLILKGQPDLGDMDSDSLWAQILKSSNILSKQGYIIKKSGTWHITVKGLKYMNDNHGIKEEKKTIGTFIKNIPNIWKVIIVVIPIIIAYLTYKVNYLNYIEAKRSNEIAIQESGKQDSILIADKQPIFQIIKKNHCVENKYEDGYQYWMADTITYQTLEVINVGSPIQELYVIDVWSVLQFVNLIDEGDGVLFRFSYIPYPKWYEWKYTHNKIGVLYEASSYKYDWIEHLYEVLAIQESIKDSTEYSIQIRDFITIRYIDIMGKRQVKAFCDYQEISVDNYDLIHNLYVKEGFNFKLPNRELGDCNLDRVIDSYPTKIGVFQLKDSLKYIFPPELRVLNGYPMYSKWP